MANKKLSDAKNAKKDEFYTQYEDIQREVNAYLEYNPDIFKGKTVLLPCDDPEWSNFTSFFAQNFENLGLKKLISTSYAMENRNLNDSYQLTLFETEAPQFDQSKTKSHGKIFTLTRDKNKSGNIDIEDLEWQYLDSDGDFRSDEVKALRDEADIIITNPPFSLFREFLAWIVEANKKFLIIGNQNAITYKEIFPLIMKNEMWLGMGFKGGAAHFINKFYNDYATAGDHREGMIRVSGVVWFTNLEHGRRHEPLSLMSEADNLKYSKHKEIRNIGYSKYDNYDAIEVPFTDAIPSDYEGVMGVPITFLNKYNPDQFEILGMCENLDLYGLKTKVYTSAECRERYYEIFGKKGTYDMNASGVVNGYKVYQRILIRKR
ncbi:adenine-specific methyltransferase EcoRI family protein [Bacillus cereus]|nr:adenine-specific methyltransferase EcoRI family protein [Bacillus cereus]MDA2699066.1 adenine-specific methyltransferase EcoRI family protein [Bacillus cereus]MDA2721197.1 adenine-specific methyltransferase EcoRI family protein [Bacillus cereus]MDA2726582.1 adenine-specific methyltransferase EcoRI family protein [Bacillus cereus]